jgi:hypothetical protein
MQRVPSCCKGHKVKALRICSPVLCERNPNLRSTNQTKNLLRNGNVLRYSLGNFTLRC